MSDATLRAATASLLFLTTLLAPTPARSQTGGPVDLSVLEDPSGMPLTEAPGPASGPPAAGSAAMEQLIAFLEKRIEAEDPSGSPESRRRALLDALQMMGIEIPKQAAANPTLPKAELLGALTHDEEKPAQAATRIETAERVLRTFPGLELLGPRTAPDRPPLPVLAQRVLSGVEARPQALPVGTGLSRLYAEPVSPEAPGIGHDPGAQSGEVLSPEDLARKARIQALLKSTQGEHARPRFQSGSNQVLLRLRRMNAQPGVQDGG